MSTTIGLVAEESSPEVIYLFEYDGAIVWCDSDESQDNSGVKYIRADVAVGSRKLGAGQDLLKRLKKRKKENGDVRTYRWADQLVERARLLIR